MQSPGGQFRACRARAREHCRAALTDVRGFEGATASTIAARLGIERIAAVILCMPGSGAAA